MCRSDVGKEPGVEDQVENSGRGQKIFCQLYHMQVISDIHALLRRNIKKKK